MVQIRITASIKKLGNTSIEVLTEAAEAVGLEEIVVTSTQRTPEAQAEVMLHNLETNHHISYKWPGKQVNDLARSLRRKKIAREEILKAMVAEIIKLADEGKEGRVSKHCVSNEQYDKLNVIDISHHSMPTDKVEAFIIAMAKKKEVTQIFQSYNKNLVGYLAGEPALHFEIEQA